MKLTIIPAPTPTNRTQPVQTNPTARRERIAPAFWTFASVLSLIVNLALIVVVVLLASQLFAIKRLVSDQLIGGLYSNFQKMDQAHIRTSIPVKTNVPAQFDLPLKTDTTVTLTQATTIRSATVSVYGGVLTISSAPTDIILPAGTVLPVHLDMTVPVNQTIPVEMTVDVDIPLAQTDLHEPFTGLQAVLDPYYTLLNDLPDTWGEAFCGGDGCLGATP